MKIKQSEFRAKGLTFVCSCPNCNKQLATKISPWKNNVATVMCNWCNTNIPIQKDKPNRRIGNGYELNPVEKSVMKAQYHKLDLAEVAFNFGRDLRRSIHQLGRKYGWSNPKEIAEAKNKINLTKGRSKNSLGNFANRQPTKEQRKKRKKDD